jgi:polyhydroxybutyrate depolymerase
VINAPSSWAEFESNPLPQIENQAGQRNSIHDRLVDTAYSVKESIKEQIRKTVYNDKGLDLPEISFFKTPVEYKAPVEQRRPGMAPAIIRGDAGVFMHLDNRSGGANRSFVYADRPSAAERQVVKPSDMRPVIRSSEYANYDIKGEKGFDKRFEIKSDGREREYLLHVPPGYDGKKPMPLVVVLHGLSQDADSIAKLSAMSEKADKEGFIVAYPNATKWLGAKSLRAWDVDNGVQIPGTDSNDVGFVRDMVKAIKDNMAVDENRVFAAGFSNGGMLTYRLASEMSDVFSAVAVVAGGTNGKEVKPASEVSVLAIHGTKDHVVPRNGLPFGSALVDLGVPDFKSFRDSFKHWKELVGIESAPELQRADDVVSARAVNPNTGTEVVSYLIKDGTHEWPGSARANRDNPNSPEAKFHATDKIWDFFKAHPKRVERGQTDMFSDLMSV